MNNQFDDVPDWLLSILSRPLLLLVATVIVVAGIPGVLVFYLDHRITTLADTAHDRRRADELGGATPGEIPQQIMVGQTVYVPLYSHVYYGEGQRLQLAGTLSVRNTDTQHALTITGVQYFDTEGTLLREFLDTPLKLKSMGSTDFLIGQSDTQGGAGANFVVDWVSDEPVHEPIVEAVMVGHTGSGIATFVRPGVVTSQVVPNDETE